MIDLFTLAGRVAVVTGGSRGIGYAISEKLAAEGMSVAILSKSKENVERASLELHQKGLCCRGFVCDVTSPVDIKNALCQVYECFQAIDVVVNCAGVLDKRRFEDLSEAEWDRVLDTNLKGTFFVMQHATPYLERSAAPRIINISSNAGRMGGYENGLAYSASKGGIIALTYGAARKLAPKNITVNCVAPGTIESGMAKAYDEKARSRLLSRFPLGRLGTPEEVAAAVCYFASVESGFTTGAVLDVNGGMFMG